MRRNKKTQELKKIIQAEKRINEIWALMRKIPPIKLDKKIFVGHWRFLKVRDDILRSSIGNQVKRVVDACNTWVRGKKGDDSSFKCGTEMWNRWMKDSYYSDKQYLRPLGAKEYADADFPEFFARKWFLVREIYIRAGTKNIPIYRYYPDVPWRMLEFDYAPAYITEVSDRSPDLESELHRLYQFMERTNGWQRLHSRRKDEYDLSLGRLHEREKILDKEVREVLTYGE